MSVEEEAKKRFGEARKRVAAREGEQRAKLEAEIRAIRERTLRKLPRT
jgi:hypothetical protein